MKILYGCCYKADLDLPNITYVDVLPNLKKSNNCVYIQQDIRDLDFNQFDIILCSPPCNYYSRANYRRNESEYALRTKDLLPLCINRAYLTHKPFIVENVRSPKLFSQLDIPADIFIYVYGRHTYFTNVMIDFSNIPQRQDFIAGGKLINYHDPSGREGGFNVNNVFKYFLSYVLKKDL